jgi:hypothetical protein
LNLASKTEKTAPVTVLDYYVIPGIMTDLNEFVYLFDGLPTELSRLRDIVQGLLVHIFWIERYGFTLPDERKEEVQIRTVTKKLRRIWELDDRPLTFSRALDRRLVGNCRDFSVLLCSALRHLKVPARARCGFGIYFLPGHYEDHWVCEYWKAEEERWVMVDAQLDSLQRQLLDIQFNPLDVPSDQFVTAGKAWLMCPEGGVDPSKFGIFDMHGVAFIQHNLIRDFLSLNKIEILPWDNWGLMKKDNQAAASEDVELMDHLARLTLAGNEAFKQIRDIYEGEPRLRMSPDWQP